MPGNRLADRLFGRPPVTSVDEKDVELVLLDLIHTCGDFLKFLVNHVTKEIADHRFRGAWRQVSGSAVITDLEILIESLMGETNAFLIECKVTHSEQPEQAERYKKRGDEGLADHSWDRYWTCLLAPADYLTPSHLARWGSVISIQEVLSWTDANLPDRSPVLESTLKAAIGKFRDGGPPADPDAAGLFKKYKELCEREFAELQSVVPEKPSTAWQTSVIFGGHQFLEERPRKVYFFHEPYTGNINLMITKMDPRELSDLIGGVKPEGSQIRRAGCSAAIYYKVQAIDPKRPFNEQEEVVRRALEHARSLHSFWRQHRRLLGFGPA